MHISEITILQLTTQNVQRKLIDYSRKFINIHMLENIQEISLKINNQGNHDPNIYTSLKLKSIRIYNTCQK